jgi:extensin-like protein
MRRCAFPAGRALCSGLVLSLALGIAPGLVFAQGTSELWHSPLPSLRPGSISYVPVRVLPALTPATTAAANPAPVHLTAPAAVPSELHTVSGPTRTPLPVLRPRVIQNAARNVASAPVPLYSPRASIGPAIRICNSRAIRGENLSDIAPALPGCGLKNGVRVVSVSGVTLSPPATLSCRSAKALNSWVSSSVIPTLGRLGGAPAELRIATSYACRTRNNQPGAKISEHGKGSAIDISAITLKNGVALDVLSGWKDPVQGNLLRAMHRDACGAFGTVLGPDADRFHRDHFHFDTARSRGGTYCR